MLNKIKLFFIKNFNERNYLREQVEDLSHEITFHKSIHEKNRKLVYDLESEIAGLEAEAVHIRGQNNMCVHESMMARHDADVWRDKYEELFRDYERLNDFNTGMLAVGNKMVKVLPKLAKNKPLAQEWRMVVGTSIDF